MTAKTLPARAARCLLATLAVAFTVSCGGGGDKNPTEPVAATQLGIVVAPSTGARSGIALASQPVVRLLDASGNRVARAGVAVTASIGSGGGTLGGTTTVMTDIGGAASFTDLAISGVVGARTLRFSAAGLTAATSATIALEAGDPSQLVFVTQPGTTVSGAVITPPIKVALRDNAGNQTAATSAVSIAAGANTSSATLHGTQTVNAVAGIATFSDISIDGSGSDFVLVASSGSIPQVASDMFIIDAAPTVVSTTPVNGATAVALGQSITVTFSEPVIAATSAFKLECPAATPVAITVSASPAMTYTITPQAALPQATTCRLTLVAASIHDADTADGPDAMANDYVATFTTMAFHATDDDWSIDAAKRVIGNTSFVSSNGTPSFGVTDNDDISSDATVIWVGWNGVAGRSEQGGDVSVTATGAQRGRVTYDARAGFEGTDRFRYIVASGAAVDTATVTLAVSGMIWFVDKNAPSCTAQASGCGRQSHPYSSLAAFQSENDGAGDHPAAGDGIFVAQAGSAYTGSLTLLAGQKLVGQDATASLATIIGVGQGVGTTTLPTMAPDDGLATRLTGPLVLAANNTLRGLEVASPSGTALSGAAIGTLHVAGDVNVIAAARALNLAGTAIDGSFGRVHASGVGADGAGVALVVQGTTGTVTLGSATDTIAGVAISFGTGSWAVPATLVRGPDDRAVSLGSGFAGSASFSGNIVKTGTTIIAIQSVNAASVTFTGASKNVSQVLLDGNNAAASIAFTNGGLHMDGGTALIALQSRVGGTLTITGLDNTATTNGSNPTVYISGSYVGAAGITLRSVGANGSSAGFWLENVSGPGRVEVTGSGASNRGNTTRGRVTARAPNDPTGSGALVLGSGGTLHATTPVLLRSAGSVVLRNIIAEGSTTNGVDVTGTTQLVLDNALVTGARQYGVYVADRSSAVITHSEVTGNNVGGDASILYQDPSPGDTVESSVVQSSAYYGIAARLQARDAEVMLQNLAISQSNFCAQFASGNFTAGLTPEFILTSSTLACQNGVSVGLAKGAATASVNIYSNSFASTASNGVEVDFVADSTDVAVGINANTARQSGAHSAPAFSFAGSGSRVRLWVAGNLVGMGDPAAPGGTNVLLVGGKQNYLASLENNMFYLTSSAAVWFNNAGTLQLTARGGDYRVDPLVGGLPAFRVDLPAAGAQCVNIVGVDVFRGTASGIRLATAAGTATVGVGGYTGATNSVSALQTYLASSAVALNNMAAAVSIGAGSTMSGVSGCTLP